jgi:hypothetical protein
LVFESLSLPPNKCKNEEFSRRIAVERSCAGHYSGNGRTIIEGSYYRIYWV